MLQQGVQVVESESLRRQEFIERMQQKLSHKMAIRRQRRQVFRTKLVRMHNW